MSVIQIIECLKCGNKEESRDATKTPWDIWPKGCPKCGNRKADVYLIVDKQNRLANKVIKIHKLMNKNGKVLKE